MKFEEVMLRELNAAIDLLEETARSRAKLTAEMIEILDAKDTEIEDLHDKIAQFESAIKKQCH